MENLFLWIKEKQLTGDTLTICEMAEMIYSDFMQQEGRLSAEEEFKASSDWFENFKKLTGIHFVIRHVDAASNL